MGKLLTGKFLSFVKCKAIGHDWHDIEAERAPSFGYYFKVRCDSCTSERHDILNIHADLLSRKYQYAVGYKEVEKMSKAEFRIIMMRGMKPKVMTKKLQRERFGT